MTASTAYHNVLLELLHFSRGAIPPAKVAKEADREHGIELEKEVVDSYIQV